jgi:hydrogenase nickel incorporation protein HypA/HybF
MLDLALTETKKHGAERISRIRLLLGEAGSVVPDCVRFYFDEMKKGTAATEAELEFQTVPLRIRCPKCGAEWGTGRERKTGTVPRPVDRKRGLYRRTPGASLRGTVPAFGPDGRSADSEPALESSIFEGMCSCNAGGEVVSGQELVIESIDVD